jgi:hypothetical protein
MAIRHTYFLYLAVAFSALAHARDPRSDEEPTIDVRKYVVGAFSAYGVRVFADRTVLFFGFNSKSKGKWETGSISEQQFTRALKVFDEVDLTQVALEPPDPMFAMAKVTIVRDGLAKSVSFRTVSPAYARVIRTLEQQLGIRDFICPRIEWLDGKLSEHGCEFEDRVLDDVLSR